jgi:hypothetical protein
MQCGQQDSDVKLMGSTVTVNSYIAVFFQDNTLEQPRLRTSSGFTANRLGGIRTINFGHPSSTDE